SLYHCCSPSPFSCLRFFFSSRRRHTRSYGDWSSDVCSSDLDCVPVCWWTLVCLTGTQSQGRTCAPHVSAAVHSAPYALARLAPRSEERRVGKECRCRGASDR